MQKDTSHPTTELPGKHHSAFTGSLIDGVQSSSTAKHLHALHTLSSSASKPLVRRALTTSNKVHKTLQSSHTLMRHAVKKPSLVTTKKVIAMDVVDYKPGQAMAKIFHTPVSERLTRARNVPKLSVISRFGDFKSPTVPSKQPFNLHIPDELTTQSKPIAAESPTYNSQPYSQQRVGSVGALLDKGLRQATSHENSAPKPKAKRLQRIGKKLHVGRRTTSALAVVFMIFTLGGAVVYLNIPRISVRYAAAKAGVTGSMPAYQPAGYAVSNHVTYKPGEIAIVYKANADDRAYVVSQKNTTWNSDALKDHLSSQSSQQLQTYPEKGQTIYLHDGTQADWVTNGVWYSIYGSSNLNPDQLIKIATSL